MRRISDPRLRLLAACLAGAITGCGGSLATPARPAEAKALLIEALDAWKSGASSESLAQRPLPLHAGDPRWQQGFQLERYELKGDAASAGHDAGFNVDLWLVSPKRQRIRESTHYIVTTEPNRTVIRGDL